MRRVSVEPQDGIGGQVPLFTAMPQVYSSRIPLATIGCRGGTSAPGTWGIVFLVAEADQGIYPHSGGGTMRPWFQDVRELAGQTEIIQGRRYGVIEMVAGHFRRLRFRPFPRWISLPDIGWLRNPYHAHAVGNRCLLYFNQPKGSARYLVLKHAVSTRDCTYATLRRAMRVLDEIARIKGSGAILCDAVNFRISARLLRRWGWEPLREAGMHRVWIKRFYGDYPPPLEGIPAGASASAGSASPDGREKHEPAIAGTIHDWQNP